jgi:hypothetical protein
MFINGVQCDTCCKIHNKNVHSCPWPEEWVSLQQDQQELHFCSIHCLHEWVGKQTIVLNDVIEHNVHPDPSAMTKAETILKWIERTKEELKEELNGALSEISRLSVLVDDIEELCREEVSPDKLELWKEVKIVRAEMIEKKDEYWRDL